MSNSEKQQKALDQAKKKQIKDAKKYYDLFSTPQGQEVLADLDARFKDIQTYIPGDPYGTHINEGGRMIMLFIHQQIQEITNAD